MRNVVLIITCLFVMSCEESSLSNKQEIMINEDVLNLFSDLRTVSSIDTIAYVGGNSKRYSIFKQLYKKASNEEFQYFLKSDSCAVVQFYSYVALKINNVSGIDTLYENYFNNIRVCDNDVCTRYSKQGDKVLRFNYQRFIDDMNPKINRIRNIIDSYGDQYFLSPEERKVIEEENKVRKEQGATPLRVE